MRTLHLARIRGIDLYLHWSWWLVALIEIEARAGAYHFVGWNVLEYLTLFAIVTVHEFGHALACRQVGGTANRIMLWPLGGIAFVDPPPRPGAMLWSIAAGPLVNVALAPILYVWAAWWSSTAWAMTHPDAIAFASAVQFINIGLLVFNLIPVYPLDGGQILRSLLWYPLGRARSLMASTIIGFVGVAALGGLALWTRDWWLGIIDVFILTSCWSGLKSARRMWQIAKLPRRPGLTCPACGTPPPMANLWRCARPACAAAFDAFAHAVCPACGMGVGRVTCPECGIGSEPRAWAGATVPGPVVNLDPAPAGHLADRS
ncbi:MAG TPA: site-2 protease family protein [Terriglobales bacterium]|jgi:Zn-dependent protease